ncbi:MAG: 30S ribosome-binding factor RbfA [Myxococcota bacterium]|jgi:ribosome-binding factor A
MSHRRGRVAHDLHARLAEILAKRVSDPRLEHATLSAVETTPDFAVARVFFWTRGDPDETLEAFEKARPFIRRCLAQNLKLRRVPELEFRLDESLERAERVDQILREVGDERAEGEGE